MRIAAIDLTRRESIDADFVALGDASARACAAGAEVVVVPAPVWFAQAGVSQPDALARLQAACPDVLFIGAPAENADSAPEPGDRRAGVKFERTPLGMTASLSGDECLDEGIAQDIAVAAPDALVLRPASESELQAEAMIERALAFSESVAGLVIVAEANGAPVGEPGHGGSAIAVLGELVAEAVGDEDVLVADLSVLPVPPPEPREPLPVLPPILAQRRAYHRGERVQVSYPAELS